MVGIVVMLMCG